jgi:hypothetical protein
METATMINRLKTHKHNRALCISASRQLRGTAAMLAFVGVNLFHVHAQETRRTAPIADDAVRNLSVVTQEWHRYPGLAVADIIFNNANYYEVRHPVIACDFLGPSGNVVASRGTTIFQTFPPQAQ